MSLSVRLSGERGRFPLDVAFDWPAEGVTALVGRSGSGKTSVLRAIAGLDRHDGEVRFAGKTWQAPGVWVPTERRRIGYVPQGPGLLPHLSVAANLDYAARRAGAGIQALATTHEEQRAHLLGSDLVCEVLGEELLGAFVACRDADAAWAADRTTDEVLESLRWIY